MALQLLCSFWQENNVEKSFRAASKDLIEEDVAYILRHTVKHNIFQDIPKDDENADHVCTTYLRLPSGSIAIARTGYYTSDENAPKDRYILHAYIAEKGEKISPFLYAINTCFKQALTQEELLSYSSYTLLPTVPFPRPQFVLNQREIQKFFSKGRQRVLSQLLQALIDGYRSKRITILNEKPSFLKYWFYAIHCCLPEQIKKDITFSTSAQERPEDCALICGASYNSILNETEMAHGNFVFDHVGGRSTESIEAVKYPVYIAQLFAENAEAAFEVSKEINGYMKLHNMSLSTSVGVMKLFDCEFDWFDSAYDIQFYLSKIGFADKEQIESIVFNLWRYFKEDAFQFTVDEQALPLLSYVFKNSDSIIKREIIEYADAHYEEFGIDETVPMNRYSAQVMDKLGFIYEFLPSALIRNNQFDAYCDYLNEDFKKLSVLLYEIIDCYSELIRVYGEESVYYICRQVFLMLIKAGKREYIIDFCRKVESLPDAFVEQVVVRGVWICAEQTIERQGSVDESLVFSIMEEIVKRPRAAAALLMVFARKGRYGKNTVSMYMDLCRRFPNETAAIDEILSRRDNFSAFMEDMSVQRFMEQKSTKLEELTYFFHHFYLKDGNQNLSFENKVQELLESLSPVLQIESADHLLRLFASSCSDYHERAFVRVLASYVMNQSVNDIYDYYANSSVDIRFLIDVFMVIDYPISNEFGAAILCVDLKSIVMHEPTQLAIKGNGSELVLELSKPYIVSELPSYNAENKLFLDKLYRYLLRAMLLLSRQKGKLVQHYGGILENFMRRSDFQDALIAFITSYDDADELRVDPIPASLLLMDIKGQLEYENILAACESVLLHGSLDKRKERFRNLLKYASSEFEREQLKDYLTTLYYSDLNIVQKLFTVSSKNLFK